MWVLGLIKIILEQKEKDTFCFFLIFTFGYL